MENREFMILLGTLALVVVIGIFIWRGRSAIPKKAPVDEGQTSLENPQHQNPHEESVPQQYDEEQTMLEEQYSKTQGAYSSPSYQYLGN